MRSLLFTVGAFMVGAVVFAVYMAFASEGSPPFTWADLLSLASLLAAGTVVFTPIAFVTLRVVGGRWLMWSSLFVGVAYVPAIIQLAYWWQRGDAILDRPWHWVMLRVTGFSFVAETSVL